MWKFSRRNRSFNPKLLNLRKKYIKDVKKAVRKNWLSKTSRDLQSAKQTHDEFVKKHEKFERGRTSIRLKILEANQKFNSYYKEKNNSNSASPRQVHFPEEDITLYPPTENETINFRRRKYTILSNIHHLPVKPILKLKSYNSARTRVQTASTSYSSRPKTQREPWTASQDHQQAWQIELEKQEMLKLTDDPVEVQRIENIFAFARTARSR